LSTPFRKWSKKRSCAAAVGVEPALLRGDLLEGADRAAAVQVVVGEAAADQHRHLDLGEVRRPARPDLVAQRPGELLLAQVVAEAVALQPFRPHLDEAVLAHPAGEEEVAVGVGEALPGADRRQRRWVGGRRPVLAEGEIGDAVQTDLAGRPGLGAGPLDQVVVVLGLGGGEEVADPVGGAGPAQIAVDEDVAARHPVGRVGRLPAGPGGESHGLRHAEDPVLAGGLEAAAALRRRQVVLAVRMRAHQHRVGPVAARAEDVYAQDRPVAHRHLDVAFEDDLGLRCRTHRDRRAHQPAEATDHVTKLLRIHGAAP
jgi:hypothetical protein